MRGVTRIIVAIVLVIVPPILIIFISTFYLVLSGHADIPDQIGNIMLTAVLASMIISPVIFLRLTRPPQVDKAIGPVDPKPKPVIIRRTLAEWREKQKTDALAHKSHSEQQRERTPKRRTRRAKTEAVFFDPRWEEGESGQRAEFTYVDSWGEVTERQIVNWRSEGKYIRGICLLRHQTRTFRKDRIEDWYALEGD